MKVGIIGLGHGQRVLFESFKLSNIKILGVASKDQKKAEIFSKKNNIIKKYKNWKEIIKDDEIDIIAIAVPAVHQIKIIRECIRYNKIIFSEKPLGTNIKSIKSIINELKFYKRNIIIDYIFCEHNAFKKFKSLIPKKSKFMSGHVDVIFNTQSYAMKNKLINWKLKPSLGGGLINLYLPHIFDYLIYFFGQIFSIKIINKNKNNFSTKLNCDINFESGITANIKIEANNPNQEHTIRYSNEKSELILQNKGKDYTKNFILYLITIIKNKRLMKIIKFNNDIKKFKKDSRILLSSKLINKLKKPMSRKNHLESIKRYFYVEKVLNKARLSLNLNKEMKIN